MSGKRTKWLRALVESLGVPITRQGWRRLKRAYRPGRNMTAEVDKLVRQDASRLWKRMTPEQKEEFVRRQMR